MNLSRQMQGLADLYSTVKPIVESNKTQQPINTGKKFASAGDKNSQVLNELYTKIASPNNKQQLVKEGAEEEHMRPEYRVSAREEGDANPDESAREKVILNAVMAVADSYGPEDDVNSLVFSIDDHVKSKTGKGLTASEDQMVIDSLKRLMKQEDEIDVKKSDLNKDGKLSEYEQARGAAIDSAMGGNGALPVQAKIEEKKSYSAKEAHKGKDIGKPGKQFKKIAKGAAKKYGSKKAGEKVAGAVLAKLRKEKFEQFGKTKHLTNSTNYKLQSPKGYKPAGSGKNTAVKVTHNKPVKDTFLAADEAPSEPAFISNSGPKSDGVKVPEDPIEPGKKNKNNYYDVNKFSQGVGKINEKNINNGMSKSTFDKLFEDVMADDDAIALGATDAAIDAEGDLGGEDTGDEVTLTIPRDVAEHLHSLLSDLLGGAGEELEGGIETEAEGAAENDTGEEDEMTYGEEIEAEEIGTPIVNQKKGHPTPVTGKGNVVDSTVSKLAKPGKVGDSKVTDKVGDDGDEGTPLVNQKKGMELANPKGKSNVVKSTVSSKVGDQFFQSPN